MGRRSSDRPSGRSCGCRAGWSTKYIVPFDRTAPSSATYQPIRISLSPQPARRTPPRGRVWCPCGCGQRHGERDDLIGPPIDPATHDYGGRRWMRSTSPPCSTGQPQHARACPFWQNLRRRLEVQYARAVEVQRRLAPHTTSPSARHPARRLWRQVAAATYHQVSPATQSAPLPSHRPTRMGPRRGTLRRPSHPRTAARLGIRVKPPPLRQALTGYFDNHHASSARPCCAASTLSPPTSPPSTCPSTS